MEIKELSQEEFVRRYAELLIEIDNNYKVKKEFEEDLKRRLREGRLK